jgi:serine/threonine protein kinase
VIYRDLKPSNIMITPSGLVKLIDFGIARHFQPLSSATMVGTQGYAPPEQYRGKVETRSDLYALGATMHHALSGRDPTTEPPFSFPLLRKLCPDLNAALADLVSEALIYDVERRIRDVDEMRRRLIAIRNGAAAGADPQAAAANAAAQGRAQLQLPLKTPPPVAVPSAPPAPSAPTLLTVANEIPCPACTRSIPGDSRFCSYCAADLRALLSPGQVFDDPEAQTITLTQPAQYYRTAPPPPPLREVIRRHGRRTSLFRLLVLAVLTFLALRLILFLSSVISNIGPGDTAPSAPYSHSGGTGYGAAPDSSPSDPIRAALLRQWLDMQGYQGVQFKLSGSAISLWGKVQSEDDRETVEQEAFAVTGAATLDDHLEVVE